MLLAIDIGNSNIVIGGLENDKIVFEARIATDHIKTSDQYGVEIKNMLNLFGVPGMVVGVPTLAVLVTLLKQAVGAGLAARGIDEDGRPLQPPPDPKN